MHKVLLWCSLAAANVAVIAVAAPAHARTADEVRAAADKLVAAGDVPAAARLYGEALAEAQREGDLIEEHELSVAMEKSFRRLRRPRRSAGDGETSDERADPVRSALRELMLALDGTRSGAYASAHLYAAELLKGATEAGDTLFVTEAAEILNKRRRVKKAGRVTPALADYGDGLAAIAEGADDKAVAALSSAFGAMADEGWTDLALPAGTELIAVRLRLAQPSEAGAVMSRLGEVIGDKTDSALVQQWARLVRQRLPDMPPEVERPYARAMEPYSGGSSAGAKGGQGGRGLHAGEDPETTLARAVPKYPKKKPLVTIERGADGFVVKLGFVKRHEHEQEFQHGVKHWFDPEAGVWVSFWNRSVCLARLALRKGGGGLGERSRPSAFQAFYPLGDGEVWGVDKRGVVTIGK